MSTARVVSVNRGPVSDLEIGGQPSQSAISKGPAPGPVAVGPLGLAGDDHFDTDNHGGREQAVYAYAREDLDWWVERLGRELPSGHFGENVTTSGLEISGALIGETWQLGTTVVQVTGARIPCATFQAWMNEAHWVKRFAAAGRPGAYLRVLAAGRIAAGDEARVIDRPACQVTVAESMRAFYGDREIMRRLLEVAGRGEAWDKIGLRVLSRAGA